MTNIAATIWQPSQDPSEGEYSPSTAVNIVDPSAVALVDPSAVNIVDTGITLTAIPTSVWSASDGS